MAPPPEMKAWLNWSELSGRPVPITIDEYRKALRYFPRSAILIACARFSIIFNFGPEANTVASEEATEYWAARLFNPTYAPRALAFSKQGRPIFFQGQVRFLHAQMKLVQVSPQSIESLMNRTGSLPLSLGDLLAVIPMNWREQAFNLPAKSA